ncbi:hypothetical protein WN48_10602 [Eufriesea mexicana]|uniref:Uncharacterized protein n=1 Tax=Eufriesea mexicana TaxID=516756 RepID=A0A310S930_9HYME|nr:hypothetical protein WN48_10602 [Eufriesea mexicana]
MLNEFSGENDNFSNWRRQAELLQQTYHLDESSTRILISLRVRVDCFLGACVSTSGFAQYVGSSGRGLASRSVVRYLWRTNFFFCADCRGVAVDIVDAVTAQDGAGGRPLAAGLRREDRGLAAGPLRSESGLAAKDRGAAVGLAVPAAQPGGARQTPAWSNASRGSQYARCWDFSTDILDAATAQDGEGGRPLAAATAGACAPRDSIAASDVTAKGPGSEGAVARNLPSGCQRWNRSDRQNCFKWRHAREYSDEDGRGRAQGAQRNSKSQNTTEQHRLALLRTEPHRITSGYPLPSKIERVADNSTV